MRFSDVSSDVCSSDLVAADTRQRSYVYHACARFGTTGFNPAWLWESFQFHVGLFLLQKFCANKERPFATFRRREVYGGYDDVFIAGLIAFVSCKRRSGEHTSELQSLMRISYAVFCLKKKKNQ